MMSATISYGVLTIGCVLLAVLVDRRVSSRPGMAAAVGDITQGLLMGAAIYSFLAALIPNDPPLPLWFIPFYPVAVLAGIGLRARITGAMPHRRSWPTSWRR